MVTLILQYIAAHWIAWLFAGISGALLPAYHKLSGQLKAEQVKAQASFIWGVDTVRWEIGTIWSICLSRTRRLAAMELEKNFITDAWPWNMDRRKERMKDEYE